MAAHVLRRIGQMRAAAVTRSDVKLLLARLADRPACYNRVLVSVSAVFSWAISEEIAGVTANPCAMIKRMALRSRERVLSDAELRSLWPHLDVVFKIVMLTGCRPGEAFALRAEDVSADGIWTQPGLPVGTWPGVKNSKTHTVPLSELAQSLVAEHIAHRRGKRACEWRFQQLWRRLEIPQLTPHDLRRSFATMVTRFGFGRPAMDRLLNHADRSVGSIYDRFSYEREDRAIVDAVARHVINLVEGRTEDNVVRLR